MNTSSNITSTDAPPEVTVISPFFNEKDILCASVDKMISVLRNDFNSWEFILVNDGSTDGSGSILKEHLSTLNEPNVILLSYSPNQGRGRALREGVKVARGEIIVTTEADLSWGKNIVKNLYEALQSNPDIDFVIASPHLKGGGYIGVPFIRRLLSMWGNIMISAFFQSSVTMHTGMTRAYRCGVIQPLKTISYDKEFHLEVLQKLLSLGFRVSEIPAYLNWDLRRRNGIKSKVKSNVLTKRMYNTISTHLSFLAIAQPMRTFGTLAFVTLVLAIIFGVASIVSFLIGKVAIFLGLVSLFMTMFCLLFIGFSILFIEIKEIAVSNWRKYYPDSDLAPSTDTWTVNSAND